MNNNEEAVNFGFKFINDPIYGGIPLSTLEMEIISLPIFQRLRGLKQLAHVNYVFPTAEHSRFAHSLGVLFIMGKMADKLFREKSLTQEDVVYLRTAALLHDIGHYPLSHLGEAAYSYWKDNEQANQYLMQKDDSADDTAKVSGNKFKLSHISSYHSKSAHHEDLGKYIVENHTGLLQIFSKYELDPNIIGGTIVGGRGPKDMKYAQLLHSSLDADRLDYLLRDSFQTGVRYGLVDYEYLIRLLTLKKDHVFTDSAEKMDVIAWNKKGQHVLEHFLMSRYFHYSQIVGHKTSLAFESVIKAMYVKVIKEKYIYNSFEDIKKNINNDDFIKFNDSQLYQAFIEQSKKSDTSFNDMYKCFMNRKRPKTIYEVKSLYNGNEPKNIVLLRHILTKSPEEIDKALGLDGNQWGYYSIPINVEKIPRRNSVTELLQAKDYEALREAIKIYDGEKITFLAEDPYSIINKVSEYKSEILRIFVLDSDGVDAEKMKAIIDGIIA